MIRKLERLIENQTHPSETRSRDLGTVARNIAGPRGGHGKNLNISIDCTSLVPVKLQSIGFSLTI